MASRNDAHRLARKAAELGAEILRGTVTVQLNELKVGDVSVLDWMAQFSDSEVVLMAVPIGKMDNHQETKSCNTCGRDYVGPVCPHCTEARARLRG